MLDLTQAEEAYRALPRASEAPVKRRQAIREANAIAEADIRDQFKEWLEDEYASELTPAVQELLWTKAWSAGHHAGYPEVKNHYEELAEFVEAITAASTVSEAAEVALSKTNR